MKQPLHDIDLIERYFDNALTAEETRDLQERLRKDSGLQKLFDQEKLLINTIRYQAASRDLDFLKAVEKSLSTEKNQGRQAWFAYAAAACVALLALAIWSPWSDKSPQALYTAYFRPHPNVFEPVLRSESTASRRTQAFQAYEQGDYQRASALFTDLLKEAPDPGMLMLLGNSNLMLGRTDAAKANFSELINISDDLDNAARWYLSLCHLKTGDTTQAVELLRQIVSSPSSYQARARELLDKLE